jgi:hypothetical protein
VSYSPTVWEDRAELMRTFERYLRLINCHSRVAGKNRITGFVER